MGWNALGGATGGGNIALGYAAGANISSGNNNIDIGCAGTSRDSGVICLGSVGSQNKFFAAGINGVTVSGAVVLVSSSGQLGVASSSPRYKEDIEDMADTGSGLFQLRPVTFRYKHAFEDGSKPLDYGLIAEEVAEVYPGSGGQKQRRPSRDGAISQAHSDAAE